MWGCDLEVTYYRFDVSDEQTASAAVVGGAADADFLYAGERHGW